MIKLLLFQSEKCSVCHAIEPKIRALCQTDFPQVKFELIKAEESPEVCGQNMVFSFPVVLLFRNEKEIWRKQGAMGINEINEALTKAIEKAY